MPVKSQTHHIDPNNAHTESNSQYKKCNACWIKLPPEAYCFNRMGLKGLNNTCKECRAQLLRLSRKRKYNSRSKIDDSTVRSARYQNAYMIDLGLAGSTFDVVALDVVTKEIRRIGFTNPAKPALSGMSIYNADGTVFRTYSYSDLTNVKKHLLEVLKSFNLRLERNVDDALAVKALIYYF